KRCTACCGVVGLAVSAGAEDSPHANPSAKALRSAQTGQNSIAPENSLPQLGQVRWGSALMGLTVLRMRSKHRKGHNCGRTELKQTASPAPDFAPPSCQSSSARCESSPSPPLADHG